MGKPKVKDYLLLHAILLIYSLNGICAKIASSKAFLSPAFLFFYGLILFLLFFYAVAWQQVLKKMPLTVAFANKAVVIIWGILWGWMFFQEPLRIGMLIGSVIIIAGIYLVVSDDA